MDTGILISSVQLFSLVRLFATPWTAARHASLSITNSRSLLEVMSTESVMPSNHLILPSIFPSFRVFSNESVLHIRWPKFWSLSFSISPSSEYSGLISFRIEWFAVQGTPKSLLQHHSSKASASQTDVSDTKGKTTVVWPLTPPAGSPSSPCAHPLALACCPQAPWLRVPYSSTRMVFQDYGLNLGQNHGSSKGPQEKTDSTAFTEKHIGMLDTGWMA